MAGPHGPGQQPHPCSPGIAQVSENRESWRLIAETLDPVWREQFDVGSPLQFCNQSFVFRTLSEVVCRGLCGATGRGSRVFWLFEGSPELHNTGGEESRSRAAAKFF